jgi:hypothetical protein
MDTKVAFGCYVMSAMSTSNKKEYYRDSDMKLDLTQMMKSLLRDLMLVSSDLPSCIAVDKWRIDDDRQGVGHKSTELQESHQ